MYSVKEASAHIGLTDRRVRQLLVQGQIEGRRLGRIWVVLSLDYRRKTKPKTKKDRDS